MPELAKAGGFPRALPEPLDRAASVRLPYPAAVLEEKLTVLRESYRRTLPGHLAALGAKLAAARESRSEAAWAEVAQLAHRLKGTAGSYGFDALAAELEALEEILERSTHEETPADREAIDAALARARASLD